MGLLEIIVLITGVILTLTGYAYGKMGERKKVPTGYVEAVGICKEHVSKNGKYHELFEIVHNGKTLKYEYPPQDSEDKLRKIDAIEKFYISENDTKKIKNSTEVAKEKMPADKKQLHVCYVAMSIGLVCIFAVLIRLLFWSR